VRRAILDRNVRVSDAYRPGTQTGCYPPAGTANAGLFTRKSPRRERYVDVVFSVASARSAQLLVLVVIVAPVVSFFVICNRNVPLVPLVGMDTACAECDRKATRTLKSAADALRVKGIYFYDKKKYAKAAPVWCERHGPDKTVENTGTAYLAALAVFATTALAYKRIAPG
jgi:hypothetical protein